MMNAQIMVIVISAVFLIAETQAGIFSSKPKNVISLKLKRLQIDPFIKNSTLSDSSCYNPIKMDSDYQHSYDITPPKQCADQKQLVKIMNQCIFLTTSYQTDLYLGSAQLEPFKMVLDLRSPWSWVKSPFCSQYDRSGTFQAQQCTFPSRIKEIPGNYSSTYACSDGCSRITDKCAEVDLVQEGLSIYGTFISSKIILSDKSFKKEIKEFKLVWAHGLSGQSLLQGDGVLGLGQQHKDAYDFEDSDEDDEVNTSIFERGAKIEFPFIQ